jgi:hypothetical protein
MPYRNLCNGTEQKSSGARAGLSSAPSRCTPLHKFRYGIGLPTVSVFQPNSHISLSSDLTIVDLGLAVLSYLGRRGPSGLLLLQTRQYSKNYPEHLRQLARYSLETGTMIPPAIVPSSPDNYQRFELAIDRWTVLREQCRRGHITERDIRYLL